MLLVLLACPPPLLVDSQETRTAPDLGFEQISVTIHSAQGRYSATCTTGPGEPERYRWTVNGSPQEPNTQVLEDLACQDEVVCTVSADGVEPLTSPLTAVHEQLVLELDVRETGGGLRCEKVCGTQDPGPFAWTQGGSSRPGPILWPQDRGLEATCTAQDSGVGAPAAAQSPRRHVELLSKDEAEVDLGQELVQEA